MIIKYQKTSKIGYITACPQSREARYWLAEPIGVEGLIFF